ncbi:hypothetical protein V1478_006626 [Vespula squamosa]|uniref:Uncharacterized protein n=1 Tax=Vespula squamosa TaxID=30214 RepID=A0ABD2B8D8_VESSQ
MIKHRIETMEIQNDCINRKVTILTTCKNVLTEYIKQLIVKLYRVSLITYVIKFVPNDMNVSLAKEDILLNMRKSNCADIMSKLNMKYLNKII